MSRIMKPVGLTVCAALAACFCLSVAAQVPNPTTIAPGAGGASVVTEGPNGIYLYHVKAVERDLDAVNYLNRAGATKIGFVGTSLAPGASGEAKVQSVTGKTRIDANFNGLMPANTYGPEYLTYVLWAISADGRPQNLGELELDGNKANLSVSSSFQSFGLIVTAEPYFAVSQPSDVVVLQNVFTDKTQGILQHVNIHYSLLPKGMYANTGGAGSVANPITDRQHYPLALYEAHNAARIAAQAGANQYAPDIMSEVRTDIQNADALQGSSHRDVHMIFTEAREATQRAEDARISALRKEAAARAATNQQERIDAEHQAAAAQHQAAAAQQQAAASQQQAAESQAQADAASAARAQAEAERAHAEAEAADARAQANEAQQNAAKAQQSVRATREKLRAQLNSVLATSESARGLIVNMSDVLFDTGRSNLKPQAQIALAKVATILQLYTDLKVQVEGYTDSVGGDAYNQKLSENRANAVHDFLIKNGVPAANVTAQGFGKADPVADNSTAAGRAQNRRVNLVVSGSSIGVQTTSGPGANPIP